MSTIPLGAANDLSARYGLDLAENVHALLAECELLSLRDGELLCEEGRPSDGLYLLLEGSVTVLKKDAKLVARALAVAQAPAVVGHMGLVSGGQRTASLASRGGVTVARLDATAFERLMQDNGDAGDALRRLVLAAMLDQQRRASSDLVRMLNEGVDREAYPDNPTGWGEG